MAIKKIKIEIGVTECDFCGQLSQESSGVRVWVGKCALCGKDVCSAHKMESCEDGCLCPSCSKDFKFDFEYENGLVAAVGVVNRKTGKLVDSPFL